jgi:hypothetical protein
MGVNQELEISLVCGGDAGLSIMLLVDRRASFAHYRNVLLTPLEVWLLSGKGQSQVAH